MKTKRDTKGIRKMRRYLDSLLAPGERARERATKQAAKNRRIYKMKKSRRAI